MQKVFAAIALICTGCVFGSTDADPNVLAARQIHSDYIKSEQGFGLDPGRALFYDSFEGHLAQWVVPASNLAGDTWRASTTRAHYGSWALSYGGNAVISKAIEYGKVPLATKDAISLAGAQKPVMVLFACFDRQGPTGDETAFKVSVSPDLGFTWTDLTPQEAATPSIEAGTDPKLEWKRYRYDLSAYKDQAIRLRIDVQASLSNRKLPYIDDLLVAEDQ